jgi:hypothetical protein
VRRSALCFPLERQFLEHAGFVRWIANYGPSIWVTEKDEFGSWSDPVMLDTTINHPSGPTGDPWISADGRFLYFSSDRAGGAGSADIWVAERIIESRVPSLSWYLLPVLSLLLMIVALLWIRRKKLKPT